MKKFLIFIIIIIVVGYAYISFLFAFNGYPGFTQDSVAFLATTYFINHFHLLINPLYDAGIDTINHKFIFYPPLFSYTIAYIIKLMPNFDNNIQVALTIVDFFSLAVLFTTICVYLKKYKIHTTPLLLLFLIFWMFGLFSFYGITDGRPEILSRLFISCFLLNNITKKPYYYNLTDGLIIGLNLINSPISTFYLILIKIGLLIYYKDFKLKSIIQATTSFVLVMICFIAVYPYHITELISGLRNHSQNSIFKRVDHDSIKKFFGIYVTSPYAPLSISTFLVSINCACYFLFKNRRIICLTLLFVLIGLISYFSFKDMYSSYNLLVLTPIYFFVVFVVFSKIETGSRTTSVKFSFTILAFLLFINSIGYVRKTLIFFTTKDDKVTYKDFRKEFIRVYSTTDEGKKIAISFSLWPYCLDKFRNVTMTATDPSVKYIMQQQLYSGQIEPQLKTGFKIIKNSFVTKKPLFGHIPLGNIYPWFQTAIYKRK